MYVEGEGALAPMDISTLVASTEPTAFRVFHLMELHGLHQIFLFFAPIINYTPIIIVLLRFHGFKFISDACTYIWLYVHM